MRLSLANQEARLNLVLSATDQASKVIEEFAARIKSQFEQIKKIAEKAFDANQMVRPVEEAVSKINSEFGKINPQPAAKKMQEATKAEYVALSDLQRMFEETKSKINNTSLQIVKSTELTTSQLKRILQEAGQLPKNVEVYRNKFDEEFNKINETLFVTREKAEEMFNSIKEGFTNESLKATEAAQLTDSALQRILSAEMQQKVQIVRANEEIGNSFVRMFHQLNEKFDLVGLQMAAQQLEDLGRKGVEFFGSAVKSAASFDQEVWNTISSMKALNPELKNDHEIFQHLSQAALEFGSKGYFSANQVAEAMNTLAKQAIGGEKEIINASETVTNVAAANQQDLEATANVVSDIYHTFGESLTREFGNVEGAFKHIGDVMTSTLHSARLSMNDYLDTLKYCGKLAEKAGWSLDQTSLAIALLAREGIRGSQAGTTLRRMLTNLIPETSKAKEEMKNLGFITKDGANIFLDASGKLKPFDEVVRILHDRISKMPPAMQEMALKTIFGQYSLAGMAIIADTTGDKIKKMEEHFGETNITMKTLDEKSHGLGFALQKLGASFDTLKKNIGEQLAGPIEKLAGWLEKLNKQFINLDPHTKKFVVMAGAIASVVALVGGAILSAVAGFGMFVMGISAAAPVLAEIAGPAAIAVAAIAGIIAICVAVKKAWDSNWGHIQQKVKPIMDFIGKELKKGWDTVVKTVESGIKTLQQWWNKMAPDAEKAFNRIWQFLVKLKPLWQGAWEALKFIVGIVWDTIIGTIRDAWGFISGIFQLFIHLINGDWSKAWEDFKQVVWNGIKLVLDFFDVRWVGAVGRAVARVLSHLGIFKKDGVKVLEGFMKDGLKICEDLFKYLGKLFGDGVKLLGDIFKGGWQVIKDVLKLFTDLCKGDTKSFWKDLSNLFKDGSKWVQDIIKQLMKILDDLFGQLPGKAWKWATDHMKSFVKGIASHIGDVAKGAGDILKAIANELEQLPGKAWKWAANMMNNFVNGIESFAGRIKQKVMDIANWIKDHLGHFSPAKKGPLSTDDKWFPNMMKMFARGIEEYRPLIQRELFKVALDAEYALNPHMDKNKAIAQAMDFSQKTYNKLRQIYAEVFHPKEMKDPFLEAESNTAYDRIAGHTSHVPHTTSLYDRRLGHSAHHVVFNITIEGRSKETDRQLLDALQERLVRQFRTHLPMHTSF